MSHPSGNPMDAVASLMLERQRYEQWLAALENKRAITPPHVFERVRADYEARLKAVTDQLMGRTTELKETISALTARLGRLQSEENRRRDERYESELRAAVGEMTPDAWQALMRDSDSEIARMATERANVTTELARLQQILSMAGTRRAEGGLASQPASGAPGAPPRSGGFDELAFLQSVVDPHQTRNSTPPIDRSDVGRRDGIAAGERGISRVPQPPTEAGWPSRSESATVPGSPPPTSEGRSEDIKLPEEPAPVPAFLKDVPSEEVKTLKCAECGAMNYPTEWYCERCGAELAAM